MKDSQFPIARTRGLVVQEVPEEVLVFDTETDKAHCLNKTAAMVWNACDGNTSVEKIAEIVGEKTGAKVSDDLIWLAIDQLNEHRLLENSIKTKFQGESRRDVLRKIGVGTMVALPIIASLAAPRSVMALGSCGCVDDGDCGDYPPGTCATLINCFGGLCQPDP